LDLEEYLGIDHGADPATADVIARPKVPAVDAAAAAGAKKRKVSECD